MSTPPQRGHRTQRLNSGSAPLPVRLPDPATVNAPAAAETSHESAVADAALRQTVLDQLGELGQQMRLTVNVAVRQGIVSLKGTVDTPYNRLVVLTTIARFCGADRIHHELTIATPRDGRSAQSESAKALSPHLRRIALAAGAVTLVLALIWGGRFIYEQSQPRPEPFPLEVHFRGKPAAGAQLTLHPVGGDALAKPCSGQVRPDGSVLWTTREPGDGVFVGTYIMTARLHPLIKTPESVHVGENILPTALLSPESSPFRFTVSGSSATQRIELKR